MTSTLDLDAVRARFPVFATPAGQVAMFENAGGSHVCGATIEATVDHLTHRRVQPYYPGRPSTDAGAAMDHSRTRWADALGVGEDEVHFGPSTSANTFSVAAAFAEILGPGDEVIVTDADHESHRGAIERAARRAGATVRVWQPDAESGMLDVDALAALLSARTVLVHVPHVSNIVGVEHDIEAIASLVHGVGAIVSVDAVSSVPHGIPDVGASGADIWLCSLYKVFSVHQGLMVMRRAVLDRLPNQSHFFNADVVHKKMNPAGPDHAQVAAASGVLDYIVASARDHGDDPASDGEACRRMATRWRAHEDALLTPVLDWLGDDERARAVGPLDHSLGHRCPTVSFLPTRRPPPEVSAALGAANIAVGHGHFYSWRILDSLGIDPRSGVVRVSMVHYTSPDDVARLLSALEETL